MLYSALVSKAWETLSSKGDLWRPFFSKADPMSVLRDDRLQALFRHFSYKQVHSKCLPLRQLRCPPFE